VSRDVWDLADMPAGVKPPKQRRGMTEDQVATLLADLGACWHAYALPGVQLGLRPGELLPPRWDDLDIDAGVIRSGSRSS
jgi:integrase